MKKLLCSCSVDLHVVQSTIISYVVKLRPWTWNIRVKLKDICFKFLSHWPEWHWMVQKNCGLTYEAFKLFILFLFRVCTWSITAKSAVWCQTRHHASQAEGTPIDQSLEIHMYRPNYWNSAECGKHEGRCGLAGVGKLRQSQQCTAHKLPLRLSSH